MKSWLFILGHGEPKNPRVVKEAPTVLKRSIRILIVLIASFGFSLWSQDINLAFSQSIDKLKSDIYARPPKGEDIIKGIDTPSGSILESIKRQNLPAEAPGYWWQMFRNWHTPDLGMKVTALDYFFLLTRQVRFREAPSHAS